ncbi:unnamed protein product [Adineta steineri]|uniref:Uncharacterized protein n=1 Tax=Adineta steineri TaxID=433720 RepID=A0A814HYQ1_9BILA|nr:unnamed protein product [Adineta steineri]CAF1277730.1 unnamed protein product [Adineta steineri]
MGIPGFSSWLQNKYPTIVKSCVQVADGQPTSNPSGIEVDNLYLDMNEIFHLSAKIDDSSVSKNEDEIIRRIFQSIDKIFSIVRPRKLLYMAMDGVAPKAKMHNQRSKHFLDARTHVFKAGEFNKCDIKPGTIFMSKLSEHLRSYIYNRMNKNPAWSSIIVILSDANVPGEGEHKIMDFIRTQKPHNLKTSHVLLSGDSDVVLLGLTLHSDYVQIMQRIDKTESYRLLELKVLREEIKNDIQKNLPISRGRDVERIIDDWIFMCFLAGNDFLPNLLCIEFYKYDNISILINGYKEYVFKENGYLIEDMKPNLTNLKILLQPIAELEYDQITFLLNQNPALLQTSSRYLEELNIDLSLLGYCRKLAPISDRSSVEFRPPPFQKSKNPSRCNENNAGNPSSTVSKNNSSNDTTQFKKDDWYRYRFDFRKHELVERSIEVAKHYAVGLCWMLHYYYKGVPSWDWYYPYYYPPLASTFSNVENISVDFVANSKPLKPLEQMMATFPPQYAHYLPEKWRLLMLDISLPINRFWRTDFVVDPNGKPHEKQGVVKLPFVDNKELLAALKDLEAREVLESGNSTLTADEKRRNRCDDDRLFIHSTNSCYAQFNRISIHNENLITLSENMSGQILLGDDDDQFMSVGKTIVAPDPGHGSGIENNQVLSVKYRNQIT